MLNSEYPPHGARYEHGSHVGVPAVSIPCAMGLALCAGLMVPPILQWMEFGLGPYEWVGGVTGGGRTRARLSLGLLVLWLALVGIFPVCAGIGSGLLARRLRTRSRRIAWMLSIGAGLASIFGFILTIRVSDPPTWDCFALICCAVAAGAGVHMGLGWADRSLYDEVGGDWYGHRVPIGVRFPDVSDGVSLNLDWIVDLKPLPDEAAEPARSTWIELCRFPAATTDPSRELVAAYRVRRKRKWRSKSMVRSYTRIMPPTYIDREIVDGWRADG